LFAYSSQQVGISPRNMHIRSQLAHFLPQNPIVSLITTVFTAFSSFGLAAVSAWFASERWIFSRHNGKKWLQDSLDDWWDAAMSIPPFHRSLGCLHVLGLWISSIPRHMRAAATHVSSAVTPVFHRRPVGILHSSSSENPFPNTPSPRNVVAIPQGLRRDSEITFSAPPVSLTPEPKSTQDSSISSALPSEKSWGVTGTSTAPSASRGRFVQAVRNVIKMQQATSQLTRSLSPTLLIPDGMRRQVTTQPLPMQNSRVAGLVPKLRGLVPTQVLEAHQALVRHLQFSPNGKFLATSRFVFLRSGREKGHVGN
jgi:WD repeat-containing protein 26